MSKRYPWAKWTLPETIDPPRTCYTIPVPDDPFHRAAFRGALLSLASATKWQDDLGHTAKAAAAVWQEIYDLVVECENSTSTPEGWDEDLTTLCDSIRFDNAGQLQVLCCGVWNNVAGQPAQGIGGPGQPGGGGSVPSAGQCTTYHAAFSANSQWLLPATVNAGDTLTFTNPKGAGTDGGVSGIWNCPNGQTFFAGGCVGFAGPKIGDVAPSLNHMELIAKIGAVWYVADAGVITVPGGIANAQVVIQCNDSSIADNSGNYTLDVAYCNNGSSTYTHTFNFALTNGGFVDRVAAGWTPTTIGLWTAGSGWTPETQTFSGTSLHGIQIQRVLGASVHLYTAQLTYNLTKGVVDAGVSNGLYLQLSGANVAAQSVASSADTNGTGKTLTVTPGDYVINTIAIDIRDGYHASPGTPGSSLVAQLVVTGPGADPW